MVKHLYILLSLRQCTVLLQYSTIQVKCNIQTSGDTAFCPDYSRVDIAGWHLTCDPWGRECTVLYRTVLYVHSRPHEAQTSFEAISKLWNIYRNWTMVQLIFPLRCVNILRQSNVYWTVHHCNSWRMKDQLDVTCYFISLLRCSTCFGH